MKLQILVDVVSTKFLFFVFGGLYYNGKITLFQAGKRSQNSKCLLYDITKSF